MFVYIYHILHMFMQNFRQVHLLSVCPLRTDSVEDVGTRIWWAFRVAPPSELQSRNGEAESGRQEESSANF